MRSFTDLSLRHKLTLAILGTSAAAILLATASFVTYEWFTVRKAMVNDLATLAQIVGANTTAAVSFDDAVTARETLNALRAKPHIEVACIYSNVYGKNGSAFAQYARPGVTSKCPTQAPAPGHGFSTNALSLTRPIEVAQDTIGTIYIRQDLQGLWARLLLHLQVAAAVFLVGLLLALGLANLFQAIITRPLLALAGTARRVSETKDYSLRAPTAGQDEVGQLIDGFNGMLGQVEIRDRDLRKIHDKLQQQVVETGTANNDLEKALSRLKETQEQLVETEKMASLGGLVGGVAHEINTPVGVSVTAASTLKDSTTQVVENYNAGKLTDSGLRRYMETATQSSSIILNNLNRAAELIQSFKQVAVDQSNAERRRFQVDEYIHEILLSLRPTLKKTGHKIEVECDPAIAIDSFPGAFSQILTNLIMNSLIHAYDEGESGTLSIQVEQAKGHIKLCYADDGKGIPAHSHKQIFEPFFTTRRGAGGSGLGLHIVYNLTTQKMHGTIKVESEAGAGTRFIIPLPIDEKRHA